MIIREKKIFIYEFLHVFNFLSSTYGFGENSGQKIAKFLNIHLKSV